MDFKQLETFVAVVDEGSFSNAAERLQISQSMVTIHIRNLENELGTRLLNRTTRSMELNADGRLYYNYARQILKLNRDSMFALTRAQKDENTINIVATPYTSRYYLTRHMAAFRRENPAANFNITVCYNSEIQNKLQSGGFEFAFCNAKIMDSDFNVCHYDSSRLMVITPNREPFTSMAEFQKERFGDLPVITRSTSSALQQEFLRWIKQNAPTVKLNIAAAIDDTETIKRLVEDGMGVSFMSDIAVGEYVEQGRLLAFPLEGTMPRHLYFIHKKKYLSPMHEKFRDHILEAVEQRENRE